MKNVHAKKNYLVFILILTLLIFLQGCDGGEIGGGRWDKEPTPAITNFSFYGFPAAPGNINQSAKTIEVTVPYLTDVTKLISIFTTTGDSVAVGRLVQKSHKTVNDFTVPLNYTAIGLNGKEVSYTVRVIEAKNSAKAITAFSFAGYSGAAGIINEAAKTIRVTVPFNTDVTNLIANFKTTGSKVEVEAAVQKSGQTTNDFTNPVNYRVTAANGTRSIYTVYVAEAKDPSKKITSFAFTGYDGSSGVINESEKAITVTVPFDTDLTNLTAAFTTTGIKVEVKNTVQISGQTSNDFNNPVNYKVTAADGTTATYTVTTLRAPSSSKAITAFSFVGYSGSTGIIDEDAKTITVTVPFNTDTTDLIAIFTTTGSIVKVGEAVQNSTSTTNDFTESVNYTVIAADNSTATYTVNVINNPNSSKAITAFTFVEYPNISGVIDESAKTIEVTLPYGNEFTDLIAIFTSTGTRVEVDVTEQTSGVTKNDFTEDVDYYVIAADATEAKYTVTVALADPNPIAPVLGETESFVILASQKIKTTAGSVISNGDIGILDQPRINFEGFTEIEAGYFNELTNGYTYAQDDLPPDYDTPVGYPDTASFINQLRIDLETAETFLAESEFDEFARPCPSQLGNRTLTRGIYKASYNVHITSGNLTLDAQGDPDAVFIFLIYCNFSTGAPGGNIILKNGTQAKNVYFQSYCPIIIGSDTIFHGNVFAPKIFVHKHADITGRLFAVEDKVDLISNTVTKIP